MQSFPDRNTNNAAGEVTRARLLEAAAACFAGGGFAGTSVRDITAKARCNVGAVNYYFGGKQGLYVAVFEQRFSELTGRRVGALQAFRHGTEISLERVLATFAEVFLEPLTSGERGRQTMSLIMRELFDSHLPAGMFANSLIRPTMSALADALARACPGLQSQHAHLCSQSLVAQLLHVLRAHQANLGSYAPDLPDFSLHDMVAHIVRFTASGVRDYASGARTP